MLEQMRKSSRSLLIMVLFGIVIVVFIVNFGPQSQGTSCDQMKKEDSYAAKVGSQTITNNDFRYGYMLMGGAQRPAKLAQQERLKETVMDRLIERELLAETADEMGFVVTEEEVDDQIADSKITLLGNQVTVGRFQKDGVFNYEAFKMFVQFELGMTPKAFSAQQKKELEAARVRNLLRDSVSVSPEEVKAEFLRRNRQINLEYMRFVGHRFDAEIAPTEDEIAAYATKNEAKLKEIYEQKKFLYEKAPAQIKLRQILVKVPRDADDKAEKKAREKADAIVERIKKGAKGTGKDAATFAEVARQASDDAATKARGGDLGWRARGGTNLQGEAEDKLFAAKEGALVGPLKGNDGFVIAKVEGAREGHVPFDKAKRELAEEGLRREQATARAKAAAEATLAKLKQTPAATMKATYPPPSDSEEASGADTGTTPRVEETGLVALQATREGAVIGSIGTSNPLAKAAFALTPHDPFAGPFEVNNSFVIVRLKERKDPNLADLDKKKAEMVREAEMAKAERVFGDWVQARCVEAKDAKRIAVNLDQLKYEDSKDPPSYEPCASRRLLGS
jgi:peptidyl-prolyl cis-trans isomerase D